MKILSGKEIVDYKIKSLKDKFSKIENLLSLAVVQVGNNAESGVYIRKKIDFGKNVGISVLHVASLSERRIGG